MDLSWLFSFESLIALITLTIMEIVLGIDNIIFISILAGKLPHSQQNRARQTGLGLALFTRILLLASITWIASLETPLFTLPLLDTPISGRDLILLAGGIFLIYKATHEIHGKLEGEEHHETVKKAVVSFAGVIAQILVLDMVFSLDSVITAVGMAMHLEIMVIAVVLAVGVMLFAAAPISDFVNQHPTIKMLALSFLLLIGFTLVVDGLHQHIPKGYVYFAMGFSIFVEMLNLRIRSKTPPVQLHDTPPGQALTKS